MWQGTREEAVKVVQEWMTQARRNVIIPYMTTEKMNSVCDAIERLMVPDSQEAMTRERQFAEQMYVCNCDLEQVEGLATTILAGSPAAALGVTFHAGLRQVPETEQHRCSGRHDHHHPIGSRKGILDRVYAPLR